MTSQLPNLYHSLSPLEAIGASIHFFIPDTSIDLTFTYLGRRLTYPTVVETLELATDEIATSVSRYPAEPITNGFFQKVHEGVTVRLHQYTGKQLTWSLLNQLLSGIDYYLSQLKKSYELRFEIDVSEDRVGYGSLWYTGLEGSDVAKRAVSVPSQALSIINISTLAVAHSNHSLLLPILIEDGIGFSFHFFGPVMPEDLLVACFRLARQSIRTNVQLHAHDDIPNAHFSYRADNSPVSITIEAYVDNEITWLLLDHVLRDMSRHLIRERHLWGCIFEFEVHRFERPLGHGVLLYDADDAAIFPANLS